jgi:outer membrane lipoprotein SlyB
MSAVSPESNVSARSLSAVPHAVWIGGGLLCAVTAGLASALVMRTAPEPVAVAPAASPAAVVATAATPLAGISTRPVAPVASAAAKATRPSKPIAASTTPTEASTPTRIATTPAALCASCGVVESVSAVKEKGEGSGVGAVAGGVLGGVVGHQVGGGNGKTAMTVLGAIGGGLAGHEVEKRVRSETRYDVKVRMEDGSSRVFHQAQSIAVGTRVVADGSALKVARDNAASDEPRMVRTSAPTTGRS